MSSGITPAYAGRTLKKLKLRFLFRDHPRVCGKDVEFVKSLYLKPGSPTHVREELYKSCVVWNTVGITPECAGRTEDIWIANGKFKDHPRVCGKDCRVQL